MPTESFSPSKNVSPRTKKVLGFLAAIGLILIGALFIYAVLVGPSREPYREALAQYRNVYNANIAFTQSGASLNASTATDEQFKKNVDTVKATLKSLKTENEALAKVGVLADGEGKGLYVSFNTMLQKYLTHNERIVASIEVVRPVLYVCSSTMSNVQESAQSAAQIRTCAQNLAALTDIQDDDYRTMVERFSTIYTGIATNIEAAALLADPDGADKSAHTSLESEREGLLQELTTESSNLSKNLQERRSSVDITSAAMTLDKYLDKKSSIF